MDIVHRFCPPFTEATKLGKRTATHWGGWLPWPLYYVEEDSDGWFVAKRQSKVLWHDPWAGYALPDSMRRREKRPPHIRFGEDAISQAGALQFARQVGLPDLPPLHALARTFDAWEQAPGWEDGQRQAWSDLRGHGYEWNWLRLRYMAHQVDSAVLNHATVMVFGPWVRLVAGLQSSLNRLAVVTSSAFPPGQVDEMLAHPENLFDAGPAAEGELHDACDGVAQAMVALLEWAEPHWAAIRDKTGEFRLCLLPAQISNLARVLEDDSFKFGTFGPAIDTHQGVWRWLRGTGLSRFTQGGALAPPYVGALAERDPTVVPTDPWPDCAWSALLLLRFVVSEQQILGWKRFPSESIHRSYLKHAIYVLTAFAVWDGRSMALPTPKPYLSLRHAMLGMVSRDVFGGWWVRCGDLERCGKLLLAPKEGRWYHKDWGCRLGRQAREAKRRSRGNG